MNQARHDEVMGAVSAERRSQDRAKLVGRFPATCDEPLYTTPEKLAVLAEEFGEVAHVVGDMLASGDSVELRGRLLAELVQVAAVAVAWAEGELS